MGPEKLKEGPRRETIKDSGYSKRSPMNHLGLAGRKHGSRKFEMSRPVRGQEGRISNHKSEHTDNQEIVIDCEG